MTKAAIVLLADTDSHEAMGRMVNALITAKELKEAGDQTTVVFDGAGTKWVPELENPDHRYSGLFQDVKEVVSGACAYCANAFGVRDQIEGTDVRLLDDFSGHPSLRSLMADGYQVVTF
jgi:hypothetical protein